MSLKRKAVYTVQSKNNARAKSGVRSCCTARTCKPPQESKVPYFCGPFVVYLQELWNQRSQKSSPQEARKLPQALRRGMKFFISVNLKEVCGVCRLLLQHHFIALILIHSVAAKGNYARTHGNYVRTHGNYARTHGNYTRTHGNHARTHLKSCLRKQTPFSAFFWKWTLQSFSFSKVR